MPTFITTFRFTEQGTKAVKDTTKRAAAFKTDAEKKGVKVLGQYWTLGSFDGLLILEGPDAETVTASLLQVGSKGNIQTTTVQAFKAEEMDKILAKMGG
jgi:uncharacterized protein with GYD domain